MSEPQETGHVGSFAEGERELPHDDREQGHFSEGQESSHEAVGDVKGSFSEGDLKRHEAHVGSFADSDCPVCRAMETSRA